MHPRDKDQRPLGTDTSVGTQASTRGTEGSLLPRSRLLNHINSYKYVSDRVSMLDLTLPTRSGLQLKCQVVNACGLTSECAAEDSTLRDNFYAEIVSLITIPARWKLCICGDLNSKLGKLTPDAEAGVHFNMGSYSNGEALLDFLSTNTYVDTEHHGQVISLIATERQAPRSPRQFSIILTMYYARRMPLQYSKTRALMEALT